VRSVHWYYTKILQETANESTFVGKNGQSNEGMSPDIDLLIPSGRRIVDGKLSS